MIVAYFYVGEKEVEAMLIEIDDRNEQTNMKVRVGKE